MGNFYRESDVLPGGPCPKSVVYNRNRINIVAKSLLLVVAMLCAYSGVWGQQTLTIYETETSTNNYIPLYGLDGDYYQKTEFVIPANQLTTMSGKDITEMKFYINGTTTKVWGPFDVYLKEVNFTTISAWQGTTGATKVYTGNFDGTSGTVTVTFDNSYSYSGSNLLVVIYLTTTDGQWNSASFYGKEVTGASGNGYDNSSLGNCTFNQKNFIPRTTFTYETPSSCSKPTGLSITSTTDNTASLQWTRGNNENAWEYSLNDGAWQALTGNGTGSTRTGTITGLTANTAYTVKIRANCGSDYSNATATVSFRTACGTYTITAGSPYTENFDSYSGYVTSTTAPTGYPDHTMPLCWNFVNMSVDASTYPQMFLTSSSTYAVSGNCLFFKSSSSTPAYAVLPAFSNDIEDLVLKFTYKNEGTGASNGTLHVGISNNLSNLSTSFVELTNGSCAQTTTKTEMEFVFANKTDRTGNYYIVFKYEGGSSNNYYLSIDNVEVSLKPSCSKPTDLTFVSATTNTATISWAKGGSETQWQYTLDDGANWHNFASTPTGTTTIEGVITGLSASSSYNVKVRAYCSSSDQSDASNVVSFTTPCSAITAFPYIENFEGFTANTVPTCWDNSSSTSSTLSSTPYYIWGVYEYSSNKMLRMYNSLVQSGVALINSQAISIPLAGEYELSFDYSNKANCGDFTVKISQDYGLSFTNLASYSQGSTTSTTDPGEFIEADPISLTAYAGQTVIIQFFANANYGSGAIFVDNIKVALVPTCPKPRDLTFVSSTATTATISWTKGGSETQWQYTLDDGANWHNFASTTGTTTITGTISGLTANTAYTVKIRANCSGSDYSNATAAVPFRTACGTQTIPYTEDFEGELSAENIPYCWERIIGYTSYGTTYPYVYNYSYYAHGGSNSLDMYTYYYSAPTNVIALPRMNDINTLQISFYAKASSTLPEEFQIGYIKNGTFTSLAPFTLTTSYPAEPYVAYLSGAPADAERIAIRSYHSSSNVTVYVDDINVSAIPSCVAPQNLSASSITASTAAISWTDVITASSWQYRIGTGTPVTVNSKPYTISGLTANTEYTVYVRAACGGSYTDWSSPVVFRTECDVITVAIGSPYTENFDSYSGVTSTSVPTGYPDHEMPHCWTFENMSANSSTYPQMFLTSNSGYPVSGQCLFFKSSRATSAYAILPHFTNNIETLVLKFTYRNESTGTSNGTLHVGISDDLSNLATSFTDLMTCEQTTTLTDVELIFADKTNRTGNYYIVFKYVGGTNDNYYLGIDDVQVKIVSACREPSDLIVTAYTSSTASFSWTENGSATSWILEYSTHSDFSSSSTVNVSGTSTHTLTGLTPETTYYVRVKANCGGSGVSDWSDVCVITPSICRQVGSGSSTDSYLPSYTLYNYSLTQQIYTRAEVGSAGHITGISFYNGGTEKTRTYDIYLKHTTKTSFSGSTDWITVSAGEKVFSGDVTMAANAWTTITLDESFDYNGTSNLAVIMDDNTGSWSGGMSCLVYDADDMAIRVYNDNDNYDPTSPGSYSGTVMDVKNQIKFCIDNCTARPAMSFSVSSKNATMGSSFTPPTLTNGTGATFTSSNPEVATVDPATGAVTLLWIGTTTITATIEADGVYCSASASYTINVGANCYASYNISDGLSQSLDCDRFYCFYDTGGANGDYGTAEKATATFTSTGDITITFISFESEIDYDILTIYDGTEESGTLLLAAHSGVSVPPEKTAHSGVMTILWESDTENEFAGWEAVISASDCCTPRTGQFKFSSTTASALTSTGSSFVEPTLTNELVPSISTVEYLSSDTDVATVDEYGQVTIVGEGEATIYARISKTGGYCASEASYTITVTDGCTRVGDGSVSGSCSPIYGYYKKSYSQMIYTGAEIGGEGTIASIAFNSTLAGSYEHTINIYMGIVDKTSFSGSTDFVPFSQLTSVYSGTWTPAEGWNSFDITDFNYNDATKNLVVAMYSTASNYESSSMNFYSTTTTDSQVVYAYSDSSDPNPSTNDGAWSSYGGSKGVTTSRANIKLCMSTCTPLSGNFSFSQSECEATIGHPFTKPTLNNGTGRTPSYSSSNTDVATVDASGNVTIGTQEGITTIMALIPASGEYCSKVATYTITVTDGCLRVGEGTGTTGNAPLYGYYKYSYDQMIYTASEIGGAGTINSIAFKSSATNSVARNVKIYMGMTTKTTFASSTDFVPLSGLTLVYDGSIYGTWSITEGWNQFDIDGGFDYDDAGKNIVVAVYAYASTYSTSSFYSSEIADKTIYARDDNADPDPSTNDGAWGDYSGTKGVVSSRPNIKFCIDRCTTPTFAYSAGSYSYTMGNTWNPPTLSNNSGSTPTYTSSNEDVATIAADGTVTPVGSGTTTIKAEMDIFGIYCSAVSSYTLTISCSERPSGQLSFASAAMEASLSGGTQASPSLTNTTGLPVTYESSNTSVATVESDGTVTPISDGVAIITASVPANGIYCAKEVSYTLTVTCADPVIAFPAGIYNESTHTITYIQGNGIKYPEIMYNGNVLPSETSGTSSNTAVATTSSGIVRVNTTNVGTTLMVLDVPANGEYCSAHIEFTIEVTCTAPVIAYSADYNAGTSKFVINQGAALSSNLITCDGSNVLPAGTTCTSSNSSVASLSAGRIFTINASEAGTAHVVLNIPASIGKCAYSAEFDVEVNCTDATIVYSSEYEYVQQMNAAEFYLPASAAGITYNGGVLPSTITGTSTNTMIADVHDGRVWVNKGGVGTAEVTVDIPATGNYCATAISFTVTVKYDCTSSNAIGTGTTGNSNKYAPIYTDGARYSYSQQLYTAADVRTALNGGEPGLGNGACLISKVYFNYGGSNMTTDVTIYMANTTKTNVNDGEWVTGLTKTVSNKTVTFRSGWVEIELDRPFAWDGTSNLVVSVNNTTISTTAGYFNKTSTSSTYMTLYCAGSRSIEIKNKVPWYFNDAQHTDCSASRTYYRPNIKFCGVPQYTLTYNQGTSCTGSVSNMPDNQVGRGRMRLQTESPSCSGAGMSFIEWNTNASGTGDRYMPGDVFNLTSNTTLYAIFKNCSGIASSSIKVPAGQNDGGIPYYTVCYGNSVELTGASDVTGIREWKWQINTHNGEDLIILSGNPCTYTPAEVTGNDVTLLVIRDSDGCASMATGRIKVSDGVSPSPASYNVSDPICVGLDENIVIGSSAASTIRVEPKPIKITAKLGQGRTTFIPDGPNCIDDCYTSSVTFHDFSSGATVTSADNINYLRINLEHSFIIDVQIKITCPNGQSAIILEDWYQNDEGGLDNYTYTWPYRDSRLLSLGFGTPDRANDGDDECAVEDNPAGTGADYCWSNKTEIDGQTISYAGGTNHYVYETANHVSGVNHVTAYKLIKASDPEGLRNFYKPKENFFSKLEGCPLNGTWTISVCDVFGADNGYIFNWELSLDETLIPDPWTYTIEAASNSIEDIPSFVALSSSNMDISPESVANVGNYTSNLVITDNFGCDASAVPITYSVYDAVNANIVQPGMVCVGSETTINAYPMGGSFHYVWGDGLHADQRTFTTTILSNASYDVTVTNPDGCKSNAHSDVNIKYPLTGSGDGDFIWSGLSTDWNADNNWFKLENFNEGRYVLQSGTGRESPTTNSNVFVTKYYDCVSNPTLNVDDDAFAKTLNVGDGITLKGGSNTLRIAGDFELDGTADFVPESGTVRFVGSGDQTVEKSDAIAFNNVLFDQSGENINTISIDNGMTVNGAATFTKGIVDGDATFEDGSSVTNTIAEMTRASYVDGLVTKKGDCTFTFPTGGDGVLGAFNVTLASNTGDVNVKFNHKRGEGDDQTGFSLSEYPRWWNINDMCSDNSPQLDHVSNFEYWQVEGLGDGTSLSALTLKVDADARTEHFHNPSEYNKDRIFAAARYDCWKNLGDATVTITNSNQTITVAGVSSIPRTRASNFDGIVTLGSTDHSTILPIELTALTATCDGRSSLVEWTTASERNNDYFSLERSDDAINFTEVARIAGAGNSIEPLSYSYTDYGVRGGDNYYRLVQVDYDGTRTASEIVLANCIEASGEPEVLAYPNPFNGDLTVELENFGNQPARIDVYDVLGRLVYTEDVDAPQNNYQTVLHLSDLPDATYTVRVGTSTFVINRKVVKN